MKLQINSGQGPAECELAAGLLLRELLREYPSLTVPKSVGGRKVQTYRSVLLESKEDLSHLDGTVKWICVSPYRPKHKRKNWFVDVSPCEEVRQIGFEESLVRFETFRSGGPGGQHVNKVETGVRAIYLPTGLAVVSTEARSQHRNRQIALDRLCSLLARQNECGEAAFAALNRMEQLRLERGNPIRVYEGMEFIRTL